MSENVNTSVLNAIIRQKPTLYLLKNYYIRGNPITFENKSKPLAHRPWQKDILEDNHPFLVVRKSRQLGFSEVAIMKAIWFSDTHPQTKTLFTFPTNRQVKDFVKTRLDPAIHASPYLSERFDSKVASIETKRLMNDSFLMFRSASSGKMGEGVDIDCLMMDEIDRMYPNVHLAFQESLKSSKYGIQRFWSTPTVPGIGIDMFFQDSDQRFWQQKCQHCGHWQIMNVEDNIKQINPDGVNLITDEVAPNTFMFVCAKCSKWLDRDYKAEYVAKYPDRQAIRGYHISQLNFSAISADRIKQNELKYSSKQLFTNYVVGEPFIQEGMIINEQDIKSAVRFEKPILSRKDYKFVVAGTDWGGTNFTVILGMKHNGEIDCLNMFYTNDNPTNPLGAVRDLAGMITPYKPDLVVSDMGYGADRNALFMQIFRGKAYSCQFNLYKGSSKPINAWNENSKTILVDKVLNFQRLIHRLKNCEIGFWKYDENLQLIIKHAKNMRILDVEEENGLVYQDYKRLGDDHSMCSLVYALIGLERLKNPFARDNTMNFDFI